MNNYTIHDFYLTEIKINELKNWLYTKDFSKRLIITGAIGSGKTTLAKLLLKDYTQITISNYEENIQDKIDSILSKRDISMMFNKSRQYKSLIFDNIIFNSVKYIPLICNKCNSNIPIVFISDTFHKKYTTYIKNYIHIELYTTYTYTNTGDIFINDPIKLTMSLQKYNICDLFKLLVNDYNIVMFNILEYIKDKVPINILKKIYKSCIYYDNLETFKIIHNIYDCKYSIFYSIIFPLYYCSNIFFTNVKYNSYISHSIIYTQMKNIYKKNTYEMYIILLYLYVYHKHNYICKFTLNNKITTHYIKLYNLIYGCNLKPSNFKKLVNKFE